MRYNNLKVIIGKPTGFCSGVKRAIAMVKHQAEQAKNGTLVYTLGPIIHNAEVVNELKQLGVKTINNVKDLKPNKNKKSIVIIRTHGCAPEVIAKIKNLGYNVIDATCPYVRRVQNYALKFKNDGYLTVVVGDKHHPEVKGIMGYAEPNVKVLDINTKPSKKRIKMNNTRIGIIGQTTIPLEYFQHAVNTFSAGDFQEIRVFNTLCKEALNRQKISKNLSGKVDAMVVIGSRTSANTRHLADIARTSNARVYQVQDKSELRLDWRSNPQRIGVVAGTSTPQSTVFEVVKQIKKISRPRGSYAHG